jgi:hypothetical protein
VVDKDFGERAMYVMEQAKAIASSSKSWLAFSAALFDQHKGLIAKTFPGMDERELFFHTAQFDIVNDLLRDLLIRFGVRDRAPSQKSGKFMVRLPESLHAALEAEAKNEGVSLNQLVVAKLSMTLWEMVMPGRKGLDAVKAEEVGRG